MPTFTDWFPVAATGAVMTVVGSVMVFGVCRGVLRRRGRPLAERVFGR